MRLERFGHAEAVWVERPERHGKVLLDERQHRWVVLELGYKELAEGHVENLRADCRRHELVLLDLDVLRPLLAAGDLNDQGGRQVPEEGSLTNSITMDANAIFREQYIYIYIN